MGGHRLYFFCKEVSFLSFFLSNTIVILLMSYSTQTSQPYRMHLCHTKLVFETHQQVEWSHKSCNDTLHRNILLVYLILILGPCLILQ
ncbi:hypothetical protein BDF14DRAFT_1862247 [Spinellus fusiger]|nr:hypothetical protein BDF14DRAFT_1862247 [Spinellus fusiger]